MTPERRAAHIHGITCPITDEHGHARLRHACQPLVSSGSGSNTLCAPLGRSEMPERLAEEARRAGVSEATASRDSSGLGLVPAPSRDRSTSVAAIDDARFARPSPSRGPRQ